MAFQAPPVQRHKVQVLTAHFQFSGQLETVGPVENFINDPARESLSFYDIHLAPLAPGSPLKTISRPHIVILKPQIVLFYLVSDETRASIRTFTRRELLVAYTPVAVCRGYFHMPAEASARDFLGVVTVDLLPVTEAHIFPLTKLSIPFTTEADLMMVGRSHVLFYHTV